MNEGECKEADNFFYHIHLWIFINAFIWCKLLCAIKSWKKRKPLMWYSLCSSIREFSSVVYHDVEYEINYFWKWTGSTWVKSNIAIHFLIVISMNDLWYSLQSKLYIWSYILHNVLYLSWMVWHVIQS